MTGHRTMQCIDGLLKVRTALGRDRFGATWDVIGDRMERARSDGMDRMREILDAKPARELTDDEAIALLTTVLLWLGHAAALDAMEERRRGRAAQ